MKPNKLAEEYFHRKLDEIRIQQNYNCDFQSPDGILSGVIQNNTEQGPHTIAEPAILPAEIDIVQTMIGEAL
jgi:hypothetical protein